jgi:3-hydroxy acid dehydrogenase / malonic semialdehyde reductase
MEKTVLITGASSGFGKATAELLSQQGYKLILVARRLDKLQELENQLNTEIHIAQIDVRDKKQVEELFKNLPKKFQNIDILINNAGGAIGLDLAQDANLDDWEAMIDTNNKGLIYFTHFALKGMIKRNTGHIINIGSVAGSTAYTKGNVYGATKAFVRMFSKNLRADLIGTDIRVSNIEPGAAETEFSIVRFKGDKEKANAVYKDMRALKAQDIANTIKWIIDQPLRVNIDNVEIMPIDQTYGAMVINRGGK